VSVGVPEDFAIPLSFELLDALRLRLADQRAPVVERLRPGLDGEQLDAAFGDLGVRPSTEVRIWWGWSAGVPLSAVRFSYERSVGPGREFVGPDEAAGLYRQARQTAEEMAAYASTHAPNSERTKADWWWRPGWLPITTNGAGTTIACDCSVADGVPSPIHAVNWGARENFHESAAPSLGQMVTWWIEALDSGAWRYDPDAARWDYDWELVDRERQITGLI
jgi:hypothetical protein